MPRTKAATKPTKPAETHGEGEEIDPNEYPKAMYGKKPGEYKEVSSPEAQKALEAKGWKEDPQSEPTSHGHVFGKSAPEPK